MNPLFDTPRKRSGLYDDDFLTMDMCESSGIMTAIQCLIQPKKPVTDLGRGGRGVWWRRGDGEHLDFVILSWLGESMLI